MIISVIIPCYNAENTVLSAINSVVEQTVFDRVKLEIIVVDDGSNDNTIKYINHYIQEKKLDLIKIYSKKNGGVSSARNYGIKRSYGDWIAFLDADDIWHKDKLQVQMSYIDRNPDINFIGCARNEEVLSVLGKKYLLPFFPSVFELLVKMFPQTSTALVRRSVFEEVGYYREDLTHSEDGELWVRICAYGGFFYHPESLVTTGNGKKNYGERGLSSDLYLMHLGTLEILKTASNMNLISMRNYLSLKVFYYLKYIRRWVIVKFFR